MTLEFLITLTWWVIGTMIVLATPGFYLAHKYDKAKEIRAKGEMNQARLAKNCELEHQALLNNNLLQGLYGAFPPADEFRPPPEECGEPEPEPELTCDHCARRVKGHTPGELWYCEKMRGKTQEGVWKCSFCHRSWVIGEVNRAGGCPACEEAKKAVNALNDARKSRPQCKDCKRFIKQGQIRCPRCSPFSDYIESWNRWQMRLIELEPHLVDNYDGTARLSGPERVAKGLIQTYDSMGSWGGLCSASSTSEQLAIAGPTISIPTHYDRVAQAPIPSRYWQEYGTRRDIL